MPIASLRHVNPRNKQFDSDSGLHELTRGMNFHIIDTAASEYENHALLKEFLDKLMDGKEVTEGNKRP